MTFPRANPGGWALYEVLTSAQANAIDINVSNALDGAAGGDYSPSSPLKVHGKIVGEDVASRKFFYPISLGQTITATDWTWFGYTIHKWQSDQTADITKVLTFDLNRFVPLGTILQRIRLWIDPGTAEAVKADRVLASLKSVIYDGSDLITHASSYYPRGISHAPAWLDLSGGEHDGGNNESVLTDSWRTWGVNQLVGYTVYNLTDGSSGVVISNTADTVTATLSGGTGNDWDDGDVYYVDFPAGGGIYDSSTRMYFVEIGPAAGFSTGLDLFSLEIEYIENDYLMVP
jgi:hypothetical protein